MTDLKEMLRVYEESGDSCDLERILTDEILGRRKVLSKAARAVRNEDYVAAVSLIEYGKLPERAKAQEEKMICETVRKDHIIGFHRDGGLVGFDPESSDKWHDGKDCYDFAESEDTVFAINKSGIRAVDRTNGNLKWKTDVPKGQKVLYTPEGVLLDNDDQIISFDENNGKVIFKSADRPQNFVYGNGKFYVLERDNMLKSFDLRTGFKLKERKLDNHACCMENIGDLLILKGRDSIVCLDENLKNVWEYSNNNGIIKSVHPMDSGKLIVSRGYNQLLKLDVRSGDKLGEYEAPLRLVKDVAYRDGVTYVLAAADRNLSEIVALDDEGKHLPIKPIVFERSALGYSELRLKGEVLVVDTTRFIGNSLLGVWPDGKESRFFNLKSGEEYIL